MISLQQLKNADDSFQPASSVDMKEQVAALCSFENFCENGIIFIKNRKFYRKLLHKLEEGKSVHHLGAVFQESFLKEDESAVRSDVINQFRFCATVVSVDLALSRFSKLFFDQYHREVNDKVDGRKSGTARIHVSSTLAENVFIGHGVEIAENAVLHPGCVIMAQSKIGSHTILYPNVAVYPNVQIGKDCIIHANTTIGSDGFSYNYSGGKHLKVWHCGGVVIEDDVEIGSNTSIDQGTFSPTVIGAGSKIDNQVHIAHNCRLGKGVIICGQSGLAGSVIIEDFAVLGGAVNVAPDVHIGRGAQIGGMSGVTGNVPDNAIYGGHPARPLQEWLKSTAMLRRMVAKRNGNPE